MTMTPADAANMIEARVGEIRFDSAGDRLIDRASRRTYLDNPWKTITIEPEYWGLQSTVLDFMLKLLKGYLWEIKNTQHFIAVHTERPRVEDMIGRIEWLQRDEFWPEKDEWIQLLMVDFARLVPALWD